MKTAMVLTGFHEPNDIRYKGIENNFTECGWERVVRFVPNQKYRTIQKLVDQFLRAAPKGSQPLTLFGFSMGAMIALIASTILEVDNLVLCSPSGYFKEYAAELSAEDFTWAKKHLKDFGELSAKKIVAASKARRGYIIAGDKELAQWPDFNLWIQNLHQQTRWPFTVVPDTSHRIEDGEYQLIIQSVIKELS